MLFQKGERVSRSVRSPERASIRQGAVPLFTILLCLVGLVLPAPAQVTATTPVFGPTTYTRTTGSPNQYTTTFTAPAWVVSPYNLHIVNGEASGNNRVYGISSATITLNGVQVAGPSDFNQNVATLDRSVTLHPTNTLQVTLASKPGAFLTINVFGTSADHTPPQIAIVSPATGSYINTATPGIEVTYSDPVGTGEPAASGVNTSTFKATLDGVDRTSLFTLRAADASATIPLSLALSAGTHTLIISLQDNAGNSATATSQFTVDLAPPQIQIVQPALGVYLNTTSPTISIQYSDSAGLNLGTLKVVINGVNDSALFNKTASGATATISLPQGGNQIVAQIQNLAGIQASASTSFNIDTKPPTISFSSPIANSYQGSSTVGLTVQYADDQALDITKLQVTVDGTAVSMTTSANSATGTAAGLSNGQHTLIASIKDLAGNVGTAQIVFNVDTTVPAISVSQPAPNAIVSTHSPQVSIAYADAGGVNTSTLKVLVNGTDRTSLFSIGPSSATAQLSGTASLTDGQSTISTQISNLAGTVGTGTSTFTVDTTPPTIAFQAPAARINTSAPTVTISYSDSGSGVDPFSLTLSLDGADVSSLVAPGASSATGVLQLSPPLSDGTHQLSATVADRAGNRSQPATLSFVVDTKPPVLTFASPSNNSFLNNPTPALLLKYNDGTGTGVSVSTVHIQLQYGTNIPTDITNDFQIGAQQATGSIPAAASLRDGTYVLTGVANDLVGNIGTASATFVVDTVPPTATIQSPATNAFLNTSSPSVVLQYQDDNSGVDTSKLVLTVDGVNQTNILTLTAANATGTLPALPDGVHTIQLTVFDRAGNSSGVVSQTFTTDTTPPTIVVSVSPLPNAAGWNNTGVTVTFTCFDSGSGVSTCPPAVVVTGEGANQSFCGQAIDAAGNPSLQACVTVNIDKTPPTITASASPAPNAAGWNTSGVTVTFACADSLSGVAICPPPQSVTTAGANQIVKGTATDVAGNTASAQVTLNISKTPPQIIPVVSPLPNAAGWNNTNVTVSFTCTAGGAPITSCPSPQVITTEGASIPVSGTVMDAAGATATATVVIKLDKTPPTVIPNLSPGPNSSGWETTPVTVSFTCSDSLSGVATCPPSTTISSDGANQPVSGTATDVAGNTATATANVNLEQARPTISASVSPAANSAGWNNTNVTVTFTCTKSVSAIASCSPQQTVSTQGVGQIITGTVLDQAGNQATTSVTLNIDETPPSITQFTAPSQLSPGQGGSATVTVSDIAAVAGVVFQLNGTAIGTALTPPYTVTVTAPSNATSGSTLTLTAVVTDVAGNATSSNKGIQVVSSGVIVGEVLSDATGLPLTGATLQVVGQTGQSTTSDSLGRYSIPVTSNQLFLSISQPGNSGSIPAMVTVERQVSVQSGVGTVPVDARLTAIAAPTTITASGGTVGTGAITVTVPPGGSTTLFNLTPLSQQGLPGLLPLGWSPVAAFDLRTNISTSAALSANFTGVPSGILYLVTYSYNVHAWNMVTPNLSGSSGSLTVSLPSTGDFALVVPDAGNASIQIPAAGQPLTGVPMVALPTTATSSGSLSPGNIAPTGGTSMASLAVQSTTPLPSGTVIQSEVTEKYTLTSGQLISDPPRYEDILLYQNPAPPSDSVVAASFPVTPSQTFQVSQLSSGDVHMDILSGRESVRGQTGGSDAVAVQSGGATLTVAAGSLPQDTAIAVNSEAVDTTLPSSSVLVPLSEYNVDFSGQVLNAAAQLSVGAGSTAPGSNVVIAEVQRVGGVPFLVVVSMAQVTATSIVSQATPGLPGITQGGDYVFYELTVPTGFVSGVVSTSSGPVAATVQTDALPFVAFSNSTGTYTVVAAAGTVNLTASIPNTALAGTNTAQVTTGQTATANLTVVGQVESATITPANGAVGVALTAEVDITAADAFNPATVTSSSVVLTAAGSSTPVALRFVFSGGGTKLAVFPQVALQPSTQYTLQASGLANALGGLISVPTISFTTVAVTTPTYNTDALVFAMPDSNGNVAISAPANSFPAGSTILIVDQTNGVVYSLTVFNDGSVTGQMPATINDILQITLTDPSGNITTFTRSQFVAADGTTAVGPGGGTVTGPGGVSMIIPAGALTQGAVFQIQSLNQSAFPQLPNFGTATFGGGMQITASSMPSFNQEVKLAFPVPANAPAGAFYYVYRQVTDQNNNVYFETLDHAFTQGTGASAQVVMASPPFCGYRNSYGNFQTVASENFSPLATAIVKTFFLWDYDPNQPGVASQGLIVGNIYQTVEANGQTTFVPYTGQATVQITDPPYPENNVAIWNQACGTFAIFDPHFGGGPRNVTAHVNGKTYQATATEVNGIQVDDASYDVTAGLEFDYKNVGRVSFTVPPVTPPPPPPQITISILTSNGNPASGIIQTSTPLTITFASSLSVSSASINGIQYSVTTDTPPTPVAPGAFHLSSNPFTPQTPGVYSITATALPPLGGAPVTATSNFLAVQAGGTNTGITTGVAPTFSSVPSSGTNGVPTTTIPQLTFSEPVTSVAGNVTLTDAENNNVPVLLIGIRRPSDPLGPIASPVSSSDVITSLTIQPLIGLKFNETYTLSVWKSIVDLNSPPLPIQTQGNLNYAPAMFTTFGPQDLGSTDQFSSTRPVVINYNGWQRAYVGEYVNAALSAVGVVDITNPALPNDEGPKAYFVGRAVDASGQSSSPVNGNGPLVAIAAGIGEVSLPSNIWIYDVTKPDAPARLAGVSATTSAALDGSLLRIFVLGQYIYASTYPKGLQVIDMAQAIADYNQTYYTNPTQFGQQISTDGSGFGLDAVINTVPVQLNLYQNGCVPNGQNSCTPQYDSNNNIITSPATMYDVKAAVYTLPGQGNITNTEMVATGRLPLVIADPTQSLPGAILYPPQITVGSVKDLSQAPLSSPTNGCALPQNGVGQCTLQQGRALALGTVSTTSAQGASSNEPVAVVIGTGTATLGTSTTPGVPVLAVVNMSDPQNPAPQGFIQLSASPTDVVLSGTTALVGTGSNILLIDISNPSHPASVGQITNNNGGFGNLLAMTPTGFLVTTSPSSTNGGLQTAAFQPVIVTQCPAFLATVVSGAGSANPIYQTVLPVTCTINVVPATTPAANATFSLTQTNQSPAVPSSTVPLTNGSAQVQIPAGTKVSGSTVNAQSTAVNTQTAAPIPSLIQTVPVGPVHIVVDSNNDTVIDPVADPAAAQSGSKFSFWQADPNNTDNGGQDGLLDYAPARVYVKVLPSASQGSIQLGLLSTDGAVASWVLTQNAGVPPGSSDSTAAQNEKLYLTNQTTATTQLGLTGGTAKVGTTAVACGAATGMSFMTNLCASQAGLIELPNLASGNMYDLLIACTSCSQDSTWQLQVFLVAPNGTRTQLDSVPIDIRPLQNWMTIETVRNGSANQPMSYPVLDSGWMDIPSAAQNLVVLVHGFSLADSAVTSTFMPKWFKRLYWAGHPVLLPQNNTHTVGLSWPSNPGSTEYPIAYMNAFETGIPLAKFLSNQNGRKIQMMAHSLGNVVANSALSRPESQSAQVTTYLMNEPALPAEAFSTSYQANAYDLRIYDSHAVSYGWSDNTTQTPLDQMWASQWSNMQNGLPEKSCFNGTEMCPDYTNLNNWNSTLGASGYVTSPPPQYPLRWGQTRPSGQFPDTAPANSTPQRGEWLGFFAGNNSRTTVINSFNTTDATVLKVWGEMNLGQQPYIGFLGLGSDGPTTQFWSSLLSTDGGQEAIWGESQGSIPGCTTVTNCQHSNLIRQWAELAYWFPSRSGPAGATSLQAYGITSEDFSAYAPPPTSVCQGDPSLLGAAACGKIEGTPTHSYLSDSPYPMEYPAWQIVNSVLK